MSKYIHFKGSDIRREELQFTFTLSSSSAASDVYKRQTENNLVNENSIIEQIQKKVAKIMQSSLNR